VKILLSAFSCCPGAGSEPGAGWNWTLQVCRRHEVWLLTSDEFRPQIERELPGNVHAVFIPSYSRWQWLKNRFIPGLDWLYYYWWQWKAYRAARRLHVQVGFDLAHHATFHSWRTPSFLCRLGIPFVWGPIGGGETVPGALRGQLSRKGRLLERARDLSQWVAVRDPAVRQTIRRASVILAVNRDTAEILPRGCSDKVRLMSGLAMTGEESAEPLPVGERPPGFVVLAAGRLEPRKGCALSLRAFASLARSHPDATLVFTGAGPDRERLAALARELNVAQQVRFLGGLPRRAQVLGWMKAANVILLPSLRDSGGLVLLEAMVAAKPVVCLDLGGPGEVVTDQCGFKIRPGTPDQVVADLAAALEKLAGNPALCESLGQAGRRRACEDYSWDKRGESMMEIYREVTEGRKLSTQNAP